jgi:hypothetical protein
LTQEIHRREKGGRVIGCMDMNKVGLKKLKKKLIFGKSI